MLVAHRTHWKAVVPQRRCCVPGFAAVMAMDPCADLHGMMMAISSVVGLNCEAVLLAFALLTEVVVFLAVKSWGKPAVLLVPDRQLEIEWGSQVRKRQLRAQAREVEERIAGGGQPRLELEVQRGYRRYKLRRFHRALFRRL